MTDDKQDPSVVAWRFNDALNPSREPLFTDKPYVAEVWGSAHGTVTPLSLTSDLTAMKAELEEVKKERDERDEWAKVWHKIIEALATIHGLGLLDADEVIPSFGRYVDDIKDRARAAEQERDEWFREAEERADACSHLVKERDELREALSLNPRWCLEMGYDRGDEEGDYGWIVFEVSGNVNDREWEQVGFGDTPLAALKSARAALSKPKPHDEGGLRSISEDGK